MWRSVKLLINLLISSVIFNYFVLILVLLLNPQILISTTEFFALYINLFIFYGPLWFTVTGIIFFIFQFFSEKKYPIAIFFPPTISYFLFYTILITSFIFYLNYDYYYNFFSEPVKTDFIRVLLINLILIITGVIFVFFKRLNKKWIQAILLALLSYNIVFSYTSVISNSHFTLLPTKKEKNVKPLEKDWAPRKIRLVIMDALSFNLIYTLSSKQKLLNFNEILKQGVSGRITGYQPNMGLALINSALTGLRPSQFHLHTQRKFKFSSIDNEFEIAPRYIFFRNSSYLNITSFYTKKDNVVFDYISNHYERNNRKTIHFFQPDPPIRYSEKELKQKERYKLLFSNIVNSHDKKYDILNKALFFDIYLMNSMRQHWRDSNIFYSIVRFPGLETIGKYFYQYHFPQIVGNIPESKIKKYGGIIENYYELYDSIIGNLITPREDELLVIISFFEYEPLPVWRRILVNLFDKKDIYVYKSLSSQGTILLYEKNALKKNYPLKNISIYDIYPTLLYYSGFQLSKDLEGEVVREIFTDEFKLNNPIDINTNYDRSSQ